MAKKKKKLTKSQKKAKRAKNAKQQKIAQRGTRPEKSELSPAQRPASETFAKVEGTNAVGASDIRWPKSYIFKNHDEICEYLLLAAGELLTEEQRRQFCNVLDEQVAKGGHTVSSLWRVFHDFANEHISLYAHFGDKDHVEELYKTISAMLIGQIDEDAIWDFAEDIDQHAPHDKVTYNFIASALKLEFEQGRDWFELIEDDLDDDDFDSTSLEEIRQAISEASAKIKRLESIKAEKKVPQKKRKPPVVDSDLDFAPALPAEKRIEFFGDAYALLPDLNDPDKGMARTKNTFSLVSFYCNCRVFKSNYVECRHTKELQAIYEREKADTGLLNAASFSGSIYEKLLKPLSKDSKSQLESIKLSYSQPFNDAVKIYDLSGNLIFVYSGNSPDDRLRFVDRIKSDDDIRGGFRRAELVKDMYFSQLSDAERKMIDNGYRTVNTLYKSSVWYIIAYHLYLEFGANLMFVRQSGAETSGLAAYYANTQVFYLLLAPAKLNAALVKVKDKLLEEDPENMKIPSGRAFVTITPESDGCYHVQPQLVISKQPKNEVIDLASLRGLDFGGINYIEPVGFVDVEVEDESYRMYEMDAATLSGDEVPEFAFRYKTALESGHYVVPDELTDFEVLSAPEKVSVAASALDRDWCYLSFHYQSGSTDISLADIIEKRQEKHSRFVQLNNVWLDTSDEQLNVLLDNYSDLYGQPGNNGEVKLSRMALLKFAAVSPTAFSAQSGEYSDELQLLLEMRPAKQPRITSMNCSLRHYQETGLGWLYFLAVNRLGGLLCDDMGLGKTHQTMALFSALIENDNEQRPFLVICPTTVLSHWENKIKTYAPGLKPIIYHGSERELEEHHGKGDVILTSYGIMMRDIEKLQEYEFAVIAYDEVHYLKNHRTKSYRAARKLDGAVSIGLTGTPIENSLIELKSLFDLVLPGYLGRDIDFKDEYIRPIEDYDDTLRRNQLHRLITPFTLRRLKEAVLDELPPKIVDVRTCELSSEQTALYKDALATQASSLKQTLRDGSEKVPYMHIFALLDTLKQICNHPALVEKKLQNYNKRESGKWELFKEILHEVLESGQKVVIFSQYLGMIDMMGRHLKKEKVDHVTLTGSTTNRGEVIRRFNEDDDCRVFIGSLMASGTGIDLVSASIVIHYDRWWNAAKEDQATDRVHRIGQTRGVQVFKFVTEGTLEEKISAIIDRKRDLMNDIVQEDAADSLKSFDRDELLELLSDLS